MLGIMQYLKQISIKHAGKKIKQKETRKQIRSCNSIVIDDTWRRPPIIMYLQLFKSFHFLVEGGGW